ncbi:MAG: hypothetical protein AB1414_16190 [bacterium]
MKKLFLSVLCLLIVGAGCNKPTPPTNQKLVNLEEEGQLYTSPNNGFSIRLFPEYEKVNEDKNKAVCFSSEKITRCAIIFWAENVYAVHKEYKKAFENPEDFQSAAALLILEELGVLGEPIKIEKMDIKDVDAYYFQTKHKKLFTEFYRTRIEAFPKNRNLQITVFFQNKEKDLPKVVKMIESMKIIPGKKQEEETHSHTHTH